RGSYNLIPAELKFKTSCSIIKDKYMMKAQVHVSKSSAISGASSSSKKTTLLNLSCVYFSLKILLHLHLSSSFISYDLYVMEMIRLTSSSSIRQRRVYEVGDSDTIIEHEEFIDDLIKKLRDEGDGIIDPFKTAESKVESI
nr:hypothetical protein [Tanacetum cinerariifolium]